MISTKLRLTSFLKFWVSKELFLFSMLRILVYGLEIRPEACWNRIKSKWQGLKNEEIHVTTCHVITCHVWTRPESSRKVVAKGSFSNFLLFLCTSLNDLKRPSNMARRLRASPVAHSLPKVSFEKVEDEVSTQPGGVHDQQARSYGCRLSASRSYSYLMFHRQWLFRIPHARSLHSAYR